MLIQQSELFYGSYLTIIGRNGAVLLEMPRDPLTNLTSVNVIDARAAAERFVESMNIDWSKIEAGPILDVADNLWHMTYLGNGQFVFSGVLHDTYSKLRDFESEVSKLLRQKAEVLDSSHEIIKE